MGRMLFSKNSSCSGAGSAAVAKANVPTRTPAENNNRIPGITVYALTRFALARIGGTTIYSFFPALYLTFASESISMNSPGRFTLHAFSNDIERAVQVLFGGRQRWGECKDISHADFETEALFQRAIHHALSGIIGRLAGFLIFNQFDAEEQTEAASPGNEWMSFLHLLDPLQGILAEAPRVFNQTVCFKAFDTSQPCGASDRVLLVRVMTECSVGQHIQMLPRQQRGEREDSTAQPFAQHQHIRHDVVMLANEHFARAAETLWDFIQNQ